MPRQDIIPPDTDYQLARCFINWDAGSLVTTPQQQPLQDDVDGVYDEQCYHVFDKTGKCKKSSYNGRAPSDVACGATESSRTCQFDFKHVPLPDVMRIPDEGSYCCLDNQKKRYSVTRVTNLNHNNWKEELSVREKMTFSKALFHMKEKCEEIANCKEFALMGQNYEDADYYAGYLKDDTESGSFVADTPAQQPKWLFYHTDCDNSCMSPESLQDLFGASGERLQDPLVEAEVKCTEAVNIDGTNKVMALMDGLGPVSEDDGYLQDLTRHIWDAWSVDIHKLYCPNDDYNANRGMECIKSLLGEIPMDKGGIVTAIRKKFPLMHDKSDGIGTTPVAACMYGYLSASKGLGGDPCAPADDVVVNRGILEMIENYLDRQDKKANAKCWDRPPPRYRLPAQAKTCYRGIYDDDTTQSDESEALHLRRGDCHMKIANTCDSNGELCPKDALLDTAIACVSDLAIVTDEGIRKKRENQAEWRVLEHKTDGGAAVWRQIFTPEVMPNCVQQEDNPPPQPRTGWWSRPQCFTKKDDATDTCYILTNQDVRNALTERQCSEAEGVWARRASFKQMPHTPGVWRRTTPFTSTNNTTTPCTATATATEQSEMCRQQWRQSDCQGLEGCQWTAENSVWRHYEAPILPEWQADIATATTTPTGTDYICEPGYETTRTGQAWQHSDCNPGDYFTNGDDRRFARVRDVQMTKGNITERTPSWEIQYGGKCQTQKNAEVRDVLSAIGMSEVPAVRPSSPHAAAVSKLFHSACQLGQTLRCPTESPVHCKPNQPNCACHNTDPNVCQATEGCGWVSESCVLNAAEQHNEQCAAHNNEHECESSENNCFWSPPGTARVNGTCPLADCGPCRLQDKNQHFCLPQGKDRPRIANWDHVVEVSALAAALTGGWSCLGRWCRRRSPSTSVDSRGRQPRRRRRVTATGVGPPIFLHGVHDRTGGALMDEVDPLDSVARLAARSPLQYKHWMTEKALGRGDAGAGGNLGLWQETARDYARIPPLHEDTILGSHWQTQWSLLPDDGRASLQRMGWNANSWDEQRVKFGIFDNAEDGSTVNQVPQANEVSGQETRIVQRPYRTVNGVRDDIAVPPAGVSDDGESYTYFQGMMRVNDRGLSPGFYAIKHGYTSIPPLPEDVSNMRWEQLNDTQKRLMQSAGYTKVHFSKDDQQTEPLYDGKAWSCGRNRSKAQRDELCRGEDGNRCEGPGRPRECEQFARGDMRTKDWDELSGEDREKATEYGWDQQTWQSARYDDNSAEAAGRLDYMLHLDSGVAVRYSDRGAFASELDRQAQEWNAADGEQQEGQPLPAGRKDTWMILDKSSEQNDAWKDKDLCPPFCPPSQGDLVPTGDYLPDAAVHHDLPHNRKVLAAYNFLGGMDAIERQRYFSEVCGYDLIPQQAEYLRRQTYEAAHSGPNTEWQGLPLHLNKNSRKPHDRSEAGNLRDRFVLSVLSSGTEWDDLNEPQKHDLARSFVALTLNDDEKKQFILNEYNLRGAPQRTIDDKVRTELVEIQRRGSPNLNCFFDFQGRRCREHHRQLTKGYEYYQREYVDVSPQGRFLGTKKETGLQRLVSVAEPPPGWDNVANGLAQTPAPAWPGARWVRDSTTTGEFTSIGLVPSVFSNDELRRANYRELAGEDGESGLFRGLGLNGDRHGEFYRQMFEVDVDLPGPSEARTCPGKCAILPLAATITAGVAAGMAESEKSGLTANEVLVADTTIVVGTLPATVGVSLFCDKLRNRNCNSSCTACAGADGGGGSGSATGDDMATAFRNADAGRAQPDRNSAQHSGGAAGSAVDGSVQPALALDASVQVAEGQPDSVVGLVDQGIQEMKSPQDVVPLRSTGITPQQAVVREPEVPAKTDLGRSVDPDGGKLVQLLKRSSALATQLGHYAANTRFVGATSAARIVKAPRPGAPAPVWAGALRTSQAIGKSTQVVYGLDKKYRREPHGEWPWSHTVTTATDAPSVPAVFRFPHHVLDKRPTLFPRGLARHLHLRH